MAKARAAGATGEGWRSGFVGRLEVRTDHSGRRSWPAELKGRIVRESMAPGATVNAVARRHGLAPQQLTTWRRLARQGWLALPADRDDDWGTPFAALVVTEDPPPAGPGSVEGPIEIVAGTVVVRVPATTSAARIAEIAAALDAGR